MTERPTRIPVKDVAAIVTEWTQTDRLHGYIDYIAEKYGLPRTTASRWVSETRRRGLLPPGTAPRKCRTCNGTGWVRWNTPTGKRKT